MSAAGQSSFKGLALSQQSTSPLNHFGKANVSPSQFLASIPCADGQQQLVPLNGGQIIQQPNGQLYIVQQAPQSRQMSSSPNNQLGQGHLIQNPISLINYQPQMGDVAGNNANNFQGAAGANQQNPGAAGANPQFAQQLAGGQYAKNGLGAQGQAAGNGLQALADKNKQAFAQPAQPGQAHGAPHAYTTNMSAQNSIHSGIESKLGSSVSNNVSM